MVMPDSSLDFWKAVPSTKDALFNIKLPYKPPRHPVAAFIWRKRVWFETTFAIEGAEPLEKVMLTLMYLVPFGFIATFIWLFVWPLVWSYVRLVLPLSIVLRRRAVNYICSYHPQLEPSFAHRTITYATRNATGQL